MLMLEKCRLRLFDNSASGRRGGSCGGPPRHFVAWARGGVVAPTAMSGSIVLIARDCPVAAHRAVVRRNLNVSNPRMIWVCCSGRGSRELVSFRDERIDSRK